MKKIALFLVSVLFAIVLIGCQTTTTTTTTTTTPSQTQTTATTATRIENRVVNDQYTLLIQSSTMDGIFNPFFYSSAYDGDVVGLTNVGLLATDETGAVVASDYYPTVAQSYSIFYTDNLSTYAPKDQYEEGDYVVYEMVLKNGALFSDGTPIDADDVLFNYYTYLDPAYIGSSTLYTLPILGLADFRSQIPNVATYQAIAAKILEDDTRLSGYVANDVYTQAQYDAFWGDILVSGAVFAQEIVDYVNDNYTSNSYVTNYLGRGCMVENAEGFYVVSPTSGNYVAYDPANAAHVGLTRYNCTVDYAAIQADPGLQVAYGMAMWGFSQNKSALSADHTTFTGASGTVYQVSTLDAADYFNEIMLCYADENGKVDYEYVSGYETAGSDFVISAKEAFYSSYAEVGSVPSIAGLVKGTKTIDGEEYETVKVILTEQNPKAILSLGVTIAPQHYYTAGYIYGQDDIINAGVVYNSPEFIGHLESFNGYPMGAGTYKFVRVDSGDGTVYFERNTYFETMGGENVYNSNIKYVALKIVESGAEYNALDAGDVAYATVSATADVMSDIADQEKLVAVLVDNLGYGYICINPQVYPDLNFRIGLSTVFDKSVVLDYYPNGLADIIYRSQSQVSWAYPEGATAVYPYDETLATVIDYWKAAGYTWDEGTQKFTDVPAINFTLPSAADSHPAGGVYLKAQTLLATIGVTANIVVDANLIANIKKAPVGVYALAWQSSQDPDMYQVYHYLSQAESVISNGIQWLYANGDDDTLGTLEVTKLDNTVETMNQKEALGYLGYLIEEATKYMLPEERKPIYTCALTLLAQLVIEVPTYQRKNLFVYDGTIIDGTTLSTKVTPYWGPMAEIWKVSFASGIVGNTATTVILPAE